MGGNPYRGGITMNKSTDYGLSRRAFLAGTSCLARQLCLDFHARLRRGAFGTTKIRVVHVGQSVWARKTWPIELLRRQGFADVDSVEIPRSAQASSVLARAALAVTIHTVPGRPRQTDAGDPSCRFPGCCRRYDTPSQHRRNQSVRERLKGQPVASARSEMTINIVPLQHHGLRRHGSPDRYRVDYDQDARRVERIVRGS